MAADPAPIPCLTPEELGEWLDLTVEWAVQRVTSSNQEAERLVPVNRRGEWLVLRAFSENDLEALPSNAANVLVIIDEEQWGTRGGPPRLLAHPAILRARVRVLVTSADLDRGPVFDIHPVPTDEIAITGGTASDGPAPPDTSEPPRATIRVVSPWGFRLLPAKLWLPRSFVILPRDRPDRAPSFPGTATTAAGFTATQEEAIGQVLLGAGYRLAVAFIASLSLNVFALSASVRLLWQHVTRERQVVFAVTAIRIVANWTNVTSAAGWQPQNWHSPSPGGRPGLAGPGGGAPPAGGWEKPPLDIPCSPNTPRSQQPRVADWGLSMLRPDLRPWSAGVEACIT